MWTRLALLLCFVTVSVNAGTVYRFQDEKGRWHFTDQKPKRDHEQLEVVSSTKKRVAPELVWLKDNTETVLTASNPWFIPVQFELWSEGKRLQDWVVEAHGSQPVMLNKQPLTEWLDSYEYRYRMGRPTAKGDGTPLRPPIPAQGKFLISQAFHGHFSHKEEPNIYAVDIAMQLTDQVHAARDGIVVGVKDDYHMGGTDRFFLDKANYISVLHSDETYAVYAHILLGSALVKEGQRVKAGQALANAGTSGYSTGPHLHFVLRRNNGSKEVSEAFQFIAPSGVRTPVAKQWLSSKLP